MQREMWLFGKMERQFYVEFKALLIQGGEADFCVALTHKEGA